MEDYEAFYFTLRVFRQVLNVPQGRLGCLSATLVRLSQGEVYWSSETLYALPRPDEKKLSTAQHDFPVSDMIVT